MRPHKVKAIFQKILDAKDVLSAWKIMKAEAKLDRPLVMIPGVEGKFRRGCAWSIGEVKEAGIDFSLIKKLGLRIDKRRKSKHDVNVGALRELKVIFENSVEEEQTESSTVQG